MKLFKLIRSGASDAAANMALDEKIFRDYLTDGIGILRLYRWSGPSFTYGVSQDPGEQIDLAACAADGIGVARRMTGGGVLFHGDEITYSFVCSKADLGEPQGVLVAYRNICAFLMRFYRSLGLVPVFALESGKFKDACLKHELCSAAFEKYDILIGSRKIGGNAQKRNRQAVFQHGSIPCRSNWDLARKYLKFLPDSIAANVTSLSDELKTSPDKDLLEERLVSAFSETFGVHFTQGGILDEAGMVK